MKQHTFCPSTSNIYVIVYHQNMFSTELTTKYCKFPIWTRICIKYRWTKPKIFGTKNGWMRFLTEFKRTHTTIYNVYGKYSDYEYSVLMQPQWKLQQAFFHFVLKYYFKYIFFEINPTQSFNRSKWLHQHCNII